jgi:RHS repeat-associated protein
MACATLLSCAAQRLHAQAAAHTVPAISLAPHNPGYVNTNLGAALLSFVTPPYVSMDEPHSATLLYNSTQAQGIGFVQVDATDTSSTAPTKMSIQVYDPSGVAVTSETFYQAGSGANRLAAKWVTTTSAKIYQVVVKSYWSDGTVMSSTVQTRVIVLDERTSVLGAGWTVAGAQRLITATDGALILNGDGTAVFYYRSCGTCAYQAPDGEFSTLVKNADGTWLRTYPDQTKVTFDTYGLISKFDDPFGNRTTWDWNWAPDGRREPHAIIDPAGKVITLNYNVTTGMLTSISDPASRSTGITITGSDLTAVTSVDGVSQSTVTYDTQHRLSYWISETGARWDVAYDAAGGLASLTAPQRNTSDAGSTRPVTQTASLWGAVLPGSGLGSSTSPAARVNPSLVQVSVTDPRGNVTRTAVDRFGLPLSIQQPNGVVTTYQRNQHGQPTVEVTRGDSLFYSWIGQNLDHQYRTSWVYPSGSPAEKQVSWSVYYTYDPTYNQVTAINGNTTPQYFWVGTGGRVDSTAVGTTSRKWKYTYDTRGRLTSSRTPLGEVTYMYRSGTGFMNTDSVKTPLGKTSYTYNGYGLPATVTNALGQQAQLTYDVAGRVTQTQDPLLHATTSTYTSGLLTQVTDPKSQVYGFAPIPAGLDTAVTDPRGSRSRYAYNVLGLITSFTNRRGQATTTHYDALNRPDTVRLADGRTTTFSYSADQLTTIVRNAESTDTIVSDSTGRVLRETTVRGSHSYRVGYSYDSNQRPNSISLWPDPSPLTWPPGTDYTYDANGQLSGAGPTAGAQTHFGYDTDGRLSWVAFPTADTVRFSYEAGMVPQWFMFSDPNHQQRLGVQFTTDALGRVTERRTFKDPNPDSSSVYTYDAAGQLTSWTRKKEYYTCRTVTGEQICDIENWQTIATSSYTYDAAGNRTDNGAVVGTGNRLTSFAGYTLDYDNDGHVTHKYKTGFDQYLYWNSAGQLDSVKTNGSTVRFGYDGLGRRVRKTDASGNVTWYVWQGQDMAMEVNGSTGAVIASYSFLPGTDQPLIMHRSGTDYYYVQEMPGHVAAVLNGTTGNIVNQYRYGPWGEAQTVIEGVTNPFRYNSRQLDSETGLYYYRARYYDPELGRFASEDPIGLEGGINPMAYAGNDPVNARDPSGLIWVGGCVAGGCAWEWYDGGSIYGTRKGWDDSGRNWPCQRDESRQCVTHLPTQAEWTAIGRQINSIVNQSDTCAGTRKILQDWYNQGPTSGHFRLFYGTDGHNLGYPQGAPGAEAGVILSHNDLFADRYLVVHEGLHVYANRYLAPKTGPVGTQTYGDRDENGVEGNGWVYQQQKTCLHH